MANYKEQNSAATTWQRAKYVQIENNYAEYPKITFTEELITVLPDGTHTHKDVGILQETMTDPMVIFDLINPLDGSNLGFGSYGQAQVVLYSLYLYLANKRDTPPVVPTAPDPAPVDPNPAP